MSTLFAQRDAQTSIKEQLDRIFRYSEQRNSTLLAATIAYNGNDSKRNLKDALDPNNTDEMNRAKRILKKIKAFLNLSDSHEFGTLEIKNSADRQMYVQEVKFKSKSQVLSTHFTFVGFEGRYLLVEFD